jgi:glycine/D-amino acid oxidase-like deaminating enzyme
MEGKNMRTALAIIGAGPVGLAAAAHALERGLQPIILERGDSVGSSVAKWGHVRLFSAWGHNIDAAAARLLSRYGGITPDISQYPTGNDLLARYLRPLSETSPIALQLKLRHRVTSITRLGLDKTKSKGREASPFEIEAQTTEGTVIILADAVIDASGTWLSANPAGANGYPARGEEAHRKHIAYGMPDVLGAMRQRYAGKCTAVLGAGHSAIGTLVDLVRLSEQAPSTRAIWCLRGDNPQKSFGGGERDELAARGALGKAFAALIEKGRIVIEAGLRVRVISFNSGRLEIAGDGGRSVVADELVVATGFRPDLTFLNELRLGLDPLLECPPGLAELIDPNVHSCGTVPPHGAEQLTLAEPGFYIAGMKSYGRAPTFLMMTGYEQVRSIVARIAGDEVAARKVELKLPETGVCGADEFYVGGCCRPSGLMEKVAEAQPASGTCG